LDKGVTGVLEGRDISLSNQRNENENENQNQNQQFVVIVN
jgi:hypothetical protein